MGPELGSSLAGAFWLGVSYKVAVKIMARVAVFWSNSMLAHSHGWHIHAGNGKPQFLPVSASSRVAWVSSQYSSWLLPEQGRSHSPIYDFASQVTNCYFLLILLVTILTPTSVLRQNSDTNHLELMWTPQVKGHGLQQDCSHLRRICTLEDSQATWTSDQRATKSGVPTTLSEPVFGFVDFLYFSILFISAPILFSFLLAFHLVYFSGYLRYRVRLLIRDLSFLI